MFGFDAVAAFTHHVETAFDLVRKGKVAASRDLIAVALTAKERCAALRSTLPMMPTITMTPIL
jgi:two-component system chemotaxis sensor kinase CheA